MVKVLVPEPPVVVGVCAVIAEPVKPVIAEYAVENEIPALTVTDTVVVSVPTASVTVTVCVVADCVTDGVPLIWPEPGVIDSPVGRAGLMVKVLVPEPPVVVGVCAVIAAPV